MAFFKMMVFLMRNHTDLPCKANIINSNIKYKKLGFNTFDMFLPFMWVGATNI